MTWLADRENAMRLLEKEWSNAGIDYSFHKNSSIEFYNLTLGRLGNVRCEFNAGTKRYMVIRKRWGGTKPNLLIATVWYVNTSPQFLAFSFSEIYKYFDSGGYNLYSTGDQYLVTDWSKPISHSNFMKSPEDWHAKIKEVMGK